MTLSFRSKLLASHVGLALLALAIALGALHRSLARDLERQLDARLESQARGAATWVGDGTHRHPDRLAGRIANVVGADVALFDRSGALLGDSRARATAPTAAAPPEVARAALGDVGRETRSDGDGGALVRHVAVAAGEDVVVRVSAPLSDVARTLAMMRDGLSVTAAVAIAAAIALAFAAARIVERPLRTMTEQAARLAAGEYDLAFPTDSPDAFGKLGGALRSLASQVEEKLRELVEERDKLSAVLEGMSEGVIVCTAEGRVLLANAAARHVLCAPIAEGDRLADRVSEAALREELTRAPTEGDGVRELEIGRETQRSIAVATRTVVLGGKRALVAVVRDTTKLKRLMAMQRDFVANVSHELRTPIAAVLGYAETLLGGDGLDARRTSFLQIIHKQAARMAELVDELLTLAEIEARSGGERSASPVDVGALARHVSECLAPMAAARGATLRVDAAEGLVMRGEEADVERVLMNLAENGLKYGREGGTVTLRCRGDEAVVRVEVEDDGPGIDAEHLAHLFERFYRVDRGRSRAVGGAGLGLAIVKHTVEALGGSVTVSSARGHGTTFHVTMARA